MGRLFVPLVSSPASPAARCLASRGTSSHTDLRRPRISIFTAARGLVARFGGLIMHGLGKTERGEQGRDLDLTSLRSTMPAGGPLQVASASNLNMNLYATKKTAAEGMLDIALFLANITHMKTVIEQGAGYRYYAAVLTLISFSLALQIVAGVLIIIIARRDLNVVSNQRRLDYLNNVTTGVIFVTTVVNFFVSFFGSKRTGFFRWLLARLHF
ncbi:ninjurin-2 isoform X1 [Austrofundulus limnaeus]|uniref:Ninjurin-2 isoform X1 n=1 Tax=Austrofundulus limnaeus TaxID=52670 RepID=A0A2I4BQF0_AUSLI|nr:PREDICTED: ninjurin-2-like isoform X1 [Austrofundulus limnaeus]